MFYYNERCRPVSASEQTRVRELVKCLDRREVAQELEDAEERAEQRLLRHYTVAIRLDGDYVDPWDRNVKVTP